MRRKSMLYVWLFCAAMVSCSDRIYIAEDARINVGEELDVIADTTLFSSMREIRLETGSDCVLTSVDKVLMADSTLYIKDVRQDKVFLFDMAGRHVRTINNIGRGHGEYIRIIDLALDRYNDELLLLVYPQGIMHYTLDGKFKRREALDKYYTDICCDSLYYYLRNETFPNKRQATHSITVTDRKTGESKSVLRLEKEYAPFCSMGNRLYDSGGRIYFTRFFDNTIYELSGGDAVPRYCVDFGKYAFPQGKMRDFADCGELFAMSGKHKYVFGISRLKAGLRYLMFSSNLFDCVVFDTLTGRCVRSAYRLWRTDIDEQCDFYPVYGTDDKVCGVILPSVFVSMRDIVRKNPDLRKRFNGKALAMAEGFSAGDNPLIMIYTLK